MKHEIQSAANFICHLLRLNKKPIGELQLKRFRDSLYDHLLRRYRDHWFPENPIKGSGYRTVRCVDLKIDPLIIQAGKICKLSKEFLQKTLPNALTLWVNPREVTYRFGENGCICILYNNNNTEPWTHITLIDKTCQKKKQKPFISQENKPFVEYKLKTKRSPSIEQLEAYIS